VTRAERLQHAARLRRIAAAIDGSTDGRTVYAADGTPLDGAETAYGAAQDNRDGHSVHGRVGRVRRAVWRVGDTRWSATVRARTARRVTHG